ncbi:MAG: cation diffusion facilitator family transporter [Dehalococcoidales bacterium]|nr:cation diffusion facilitator family transporter [Dehalococcoidales bacterium]
MIEHSHEAEHQNAAGKNRLKITLAIVVIIMVAEIIGGILSNSLALLSDAGHMLVDALALGLSLFALTIAAKPATESKTYGYHRVEIMAALANGVTLVVVAAYIFYEAYQRFLEPPEVKAPLMLLIATIGLVANLAGVLLLRKDSHRNLNIKGAFWHILGDTVSSVGVIIGGIIISVTGLGIVDPIIAVIIGFIVLWGAVRLVKESGDILLEAAPKHIPVDEVTKMLKGIPGVKEVHDIHIWTITSGIYAMSAHLIIEDQSVSGSAEIVDKANRKLSQQFNIAHTTFQLECERCESCPPGTVCNITRPEEPTRRLQQI